jgi:RloB-like protein
MPKQKRNRNIKVAPVFKVFCEGAKTEPLYINGYINHFHSNNRKIILVEDTNKNTPVELVEVAIKAKNKGVEGDILWVVFDRESTAKYSHELHLNARNMANANGIEIALSNVCFEYWFLLHFSYSTAPYSSCDDLLNRSNLKSELKRLGINQYDKGLPLIFDKLKELYPNAVTNASHLKTQALSTAENDRELPHYLNPYVDVHELFQDMQNFIDKTPSVRLATRG